jgi:hypothetical protein
MSQLSEEGLDSMLELERARDFTPLNDWETISARLRDEGLIRDRQSRFRGTWMMQAAAAVLIALGGIGIGRYSATHAGSGQSVASTAPSSSVETPQLPISSASDTTTAFHSADEAWNALNRAGQDYQKASAYLNAMQTARSDSSGVYQTRLAALDQVMRATESAREQAPNDPVINQYYLATMGAREATAQQLHTARLVGPKPKGF